MTSFSAYLSNAALNHVFGAGSHDYTSPANLYVALFTSSTGLDSGTLSNELANSNNYSRQAITFRDGDGSALPTTTGVVENASAISFEASGGDWSAATHAAIIDSATYGAGNIVAWGALDSSKTALDGQSIDFAAGAITISLT